MTDAFKFFTIRKPETLSKGQIERKGFKTHPMHNQSGWYKKAEEIAETRDMNKLQIYANKYLNSKVSIKNLDDLSSSPELFLWISKNSIPDLFTTDKNIDEFASIQKRYKNKKEALRLLSGDLTRVADTMLAHSLVKQLGQTSLDYVKLFRSLKVIKYLVSSKENKHTYMVVKEILKRPIYLSKISGWQYQQAEAMALPSFDYLLPSKKDCCDENKQQKPNRECINTLAYVADLMVLRDELVAYEGADLAYIETVMLGEENTRTHRRLEQTESYSENETTSIGSQENDHQVNDRFSLQTEAEKTMESDLSVDAGVTAKAWGTGYEVEATTNGSYQSSKSESKRVAKEKAIEITERSVLKIQKTVRELSTKRELLEIEETNKHELSNLQSDGGVKHINGMYQFVNARYKNQVINYGKRLMLDLVLPRPMEIYKHMMNEQSSAHGFEEPKKPSFGVWEITDDYKNTPNAYYLDLAQNYNVSDLPNPPQKNLYISFEFTNDSDVSRASTNQGDITGAMKVKLGQVPSGYTTTHLALNMGAKGNYDPDTGVAAWVKLYVGGGMIQSGTLNIHFTEEEEIYGSVLYHATSAVSGAGYIVCDRNESAYNAWKLEVYEKIMNKYESDLQSYNAKVASWEAQQAQKTNFGKSTFENRMIEEEQLKRQAITYISCQFYEQFLAMKENVSPCDRPEMDLVRAKQEGLYIAFFEQVFDWSLMMYIFYPDFWAGWCHEKDSKSIATGDTLFDKALSASAARVQIPVKRGKESLMEYYLETGEVWLGNNEMPTPDDEYYISVAQEIKELSNFNADRDGKLTVINGQNYVTLNLNDSDNYYWGYMETLPVPNTNPVEYEDVYVSAQDNDAINNDIDREIMIEGISYRIVDITVDTSDTTHKTWVLTLDRIYEGIDATHVLWSTGGIYVGGPFFTTIPQNLVYLRNMKDDQGNYITSDCLPSYPQSKCE